MAGGSIASKAAGIAAFRSGGDLDETWAYQPAITTVQSVDAVGLTENRLYLGVIPQFQQSGGIGSPSPEIRIVELASGRDVVSFNACNQACSGSNVSSLAVGADRLFWIVDKSGVLKSTNIAASNSSELIFNGSINSLIPSGNRLFVAGEFDFVPGRGLLRTSLAALKQDGVALPWVTNSQLQVVRLAAGKDVIDSEIIYMSGIDPSATGSPLQLTTFDSTGRRIESWNPTGSGNITLGSNNGTVSALIAKQGMLYIGGRFDSIGGVSVANFAAVDSTGTVTTTGIPTVRGEVTSIALSDNDVILGGSFDQVGGVVRHGFAIVGVGGAVKNDELNLNAGSLVGAVAHGDGVIYLAGSFPDSNGNTGTPVVKAVNLVGVPLAIEAKIPAEYVVRSMALTNTRIIVGVTPVSGSTKPSAVFVYDTNGSLLTSWNLTGNSSGSVILAADRVNNKVYVAGDFTNVGNTLQPFFAELALP